MEFYCPKNEMILVANFISGFEIDSEVWASALYNGLINKNRFVSAPIYLFLHFDSFPRFLAEVKKW